MTRPRPFIRCARHVARFVRDRRGATAIEYGLIIALVCLAMLGALTKLAGVTTAMWGNVSTKVETAQ